MKKILFLALLITNALATKAQNKVSDQQAISMLKKFYTSYMTLIAGSEIDNKSETSLKKEYCTKKLLNNIPKLIAEIDADPIIKAQDSHLSLIKTLSFKKNNAKPNAYTVSYYYINNITKKKIITAINLTVVNENGKYKIDTIW